ncbi:hypothetical protein JCM19240_2263 [Vibrio maritimus]|uniref:Uncharacterized protein n=1 Tax=Vibrio maritimus TaxID=990268 RepID=A0A090TR26_9VIBR|nr:hypothetical protein JCM19240_2263 [Vibrio maritimus]
MESRSFNNGSDSGCASQADNVVDGEAPSPSTGCVGSVKLPNKFSGKFKLVDNPQMLAKAIGEPLSGGLCQGAVYQSTEEVTIYRAWNSTNPSSQFGSWWALAKPEGKTADYRKRL